MKKYLLGLFLGLFASVGLAQFPQVGMVGYDPSNRPILLGVDSSGNLYTSGRSSIVQAATGYIMPVAPEAIGSDGVWHNLLVDANGNLKTTSTSSGSISVIYISQLGCAAQNGDLNNPSVGTDDTVCIKAALAKATSANRVVLIQDKVSVINTGTNWLQGPATGNWEIDGLGAGVVSIPITSCTINGNVATFVTKTQSLVAGQHLVVGGFTTCTALNNQALVVNVSGLSATGFTANFNTANVGTVAENGVADYLVGTGFVDGIGTSGVNAPQNSIGTGYLNGSFTQSAFCGDPNTAVPNRFGNVSFRNFALNMNTVNNDTVGGSNTQCIGLDVANMQNTVFEGLVLYSGWTGQGVTHGVHFLTRVDNVGLVEFHNNMFLSMLPGIQPLNSMMDGIHVDGPSDNINITDNYFHTNDDPIALNAVEGFCGPITNVNIANGVYDNTYSNMRLDGNTTACTNGLTPSISNVNAVNYNGSSYGGVGTVTNVAAAVFHFNWAESFSSTAKLGPGLTVQPASWASSYSLLSWNGVNSSTGTIGCLADSAGGDSNLYCNIPTGGTYQWLVNNSAVVTFGAAGLGIPLGLNGPDTAPSGVCPINGVWTFSKDGHATYCNAGTWQSKI